MVRADFVRRKLQLIAEELSRLLEFKDLSFDEFTSDPIRLAAAERYIERIVVRAIDVNEHLLSELSDGSDEKITRLTYRDTFLKLVELGVYPLDFAERIARSAGLRNILMHEYNDVDRTILHESIASCLDDYPQYVRYVDEYLEQIGSKR